MSVTLRIEVFLPGTEAVESRISVVNDLQPFLKIHKSSSKVKVVIVSINPTKKTACVVVCAYVNKLTSITSKLSMFNQH